MKTFAQKVTRDPERLLRWLGDQLRRGDGKEKDDLGAKVRAAEAIAEINGWNRSHKEDLREMDPERLQKKVEEWAPAFLSMCSEKALEAELARRRAL